MQFKNSTVIGMFILLHLSTDSWCHYIPEKKASRKSNESLAHNDRIQICGNALTTMVIEACNGILGSPNEAYLDRETVQSKITEDCCDRECPLDYLQNFCGQTPLFTTKKTVRGRLLSRLNTRSRSSVPEAAEKSVGSGNEIERKKPEKFETQNRTWPSLQIGTISPEIDKFGGQPIVVVKKNRLSME